MRRPTVRPRRAPSPALKLEGGVSELYRLLETATAAHKAGNVADAMALYIDAAGRFPKSPAPLYYAAIAAHALGKDDEAIRLMGRVTELMPEYADAHYNLGKFYHEHRTAPNLMRAEAHYQRAIELNPDRIEALCNLGHVYGQQGRTVEQRMCWSVALAADPTHPEARFSLSFLALEAGDFARGWALYEARLACDAFVAEYGTMAADLPRWTGTPLPHGHLVLFSEQGAGDTLMFARWVQTASLLVARCSLVVPEPLRSLMQRSFPSVNVTGERPADATHALTLPSLPAVMGVDRPEALRTTVFGYLHAA